MKIGVPRERAAGESRVAMTPETAKRLKALGHVLRLETGAGEAASAPDGAYASLGVDIVNREAVYACDLILKVRAPAPEELALARPATTLIGMLDPFDGAGLQAMAAAGITAFALEAAPRSSRAQSMDVLSSQANIAGYKAVMLAANAYKKFIPMLMTAAGTVKAARVVVLGVGVAGLQAIATAKRIGAVIEASDVRPSVKEQVESLGAKFIDVPYETQDEREAAEGVGGYARPMPPIWLKRQQVEVAKSVAQADIVISTAMIPGRSAPTLITEDMVKAMKPGSVIVDLSAGRGPAGPHGKAAGNCPLTEAGTTIVRHGVTIVGETNLPAMVAADSSALYARNVFDFLKLVITKEGALHVPMEDDIVAACLMTRGGEVKRRN
jgi:H+-translocating NAD(P) transhydrogenase subunit alpha